MEIIEEIAKGNERYVVVTRKVKRIGGRKNPQSYREQVYDVQHIVGGELVGGSRYLRPTGLRNYFDRLISDYGFKPVERATEAEAQYD